MTRAGILIVPLLALTASLPAAELWDSRSLEIIQATEANFPPALLSQGVKEGSVRAVLLVDATGTLLDCLVTGYTHPQFATELLTHLRNCSFRPARQRGEAISARVDAVFNFEARGQVISLTAGEALAAHMFGQAKDQLVSLVCPMAALDEIPRPVHVVQPSHPGRRVPGQSRGTAAVDFYIDAEGRPRMPVILRASHEEFGFAALDAITQWRFSPPTRAGRPVIVRAMQQFTFPEIPPAGGGAGSVALARNIGSSGDSTSR